jgi:hypothetical protein
LLWKEQSKHKEQMKCLLHSNLVKIYREKTKHFSKKKT